MMISLPKWMERVGGGAGGQLVAFFKSVCVHFALVGAGGEAGPSAAAAAAKCAPVLCLLLIVLGQRADTPTKKHEQRRYAALVGGGLALSALGDALLVWPALLEAGMGAFAAAHACYVAAFGWRPAAWPRGVAVYAAALAYAYNVRAPGHLQPLVVVYALVLGTMAWRALARGLPAAAGAALFLLSDGALGLHMFHTPLPYAEVIIMSTYYLAQLCIALSALRPPDRSPPPSVPDRAPSPPAPAAPDAHCVGG